MKIGGETGPPRPEVHLPVEIIREIVVQVTKFISSQRTLWSWCLLSRDWYDVAVPYLYARPRLVNKNFDLFARTMCPPVNAHVRQIGLERFVKRLDMGRLAYESSNSLTARLLGRVGHSLEEFVAPPVSFSISCLAPLSKCEALRLLDLARVYQSIDVTRLLRATRKLSRLTSLTLPDTATLPLDGWLAGVSWPPNLVNLQIPGWLFQGPRMGDMVRSWPTSLANLTIKHCRTCPLLTDRAGYENVVASNITSLTLNDSQHVTEDLRMVRIFAVFPSVVSLAVPVEAVIIGRTDMTGLDLPLECLELTTVDDPDNWVRLMKEDLLQCIVNFPRLWQVAVDEHCVTGPPSTPRFHEFEYSDDLELPLKQRAAERNRLAGREEINMDEAGLFFLAE